MKWFVDKKTGHFWNEAYQNAMDEHQKEYDLRLREFLFGDLNAPSIDLPPNPELPPLKVFLGWTPMKEWISKCKPFVPTIPDQNTCCFDAHSLFRILINLQ